MELEEEELIWQAMQIDTVPHPHSPPDIDGIHLMPFAAFRFTAGIL